jgi:hypothetical protein
MSNNNLNALTSKLERVHISNQPSSAHQPTHHLRTVSSAKKGVTKVRAITRRRRNSPRRGTVKATGRAKKMVERRREEARRRAAEKKEAATAKRRETAAKRKAEEEEAREKAIVSGRTRGQAKRMKEAKMNE